MDLLLKIKEFVTSELLYYSDLLSDLAVISVTLELNSKSENVKILFQNVKCQSK